MVKNLFSKTSNKFYIYIYNLGVKKIENLIYMYSYIIVINKK
jgi:hypothetical protein